LGYLFAIVSDKCPIPPPTSTRTAPSSKMLQSNPEHSQFCQYISGSRHRPWNIVSEGSDAAVPCIPSPKRLSLYTFSRR
jgi:hypothetical protein